MSEESYTITNALLSAAPAKWDGIVSKLRPEVAADVDKTLDQISVLAAMAAAYVSKRRGTDGSGSHDHADAVKTAMRVRRKVRRALGFTYPERGEFTF